MSLAKAFRRQRDKAVHEGRSLTRHDIRTAVIEGAQGVFTPIEPRGKRGQSRVPA